MLNKKIMTYTLALLLIGTHNKNAQASADTTHRDTQDLLFKSSHADDINFLKQNIVNYPDFPKAGILFEDFFPILSNAQAFQACINLLAEYYKDKSIEVIVGLESRGFILGAALAFKLGIGFVPVRKPGKLPGPTYEVEYGKEYGSDTFVIAKSALKPNQKVLVIDDLIATGGSARAAIELIRKAGGMPVGFVALLRVQGLTANLDIPSFVLLD